MQLFRIILIAVTISAVAAPALAAEPLVTPLAYNLDLEKRDISLKTITLANPTDSQMRVYASVNEVIVDGDGVVESFSIPESDERRISPTSWIEITRARITLAPGEKKEIPFTIRMHPQTEPGEYSVLIGFASASKQHQAVAKVMAGEAPGTLVNMRVDKTQNQFLQLRSFRHDRFVLQPENETIAITLSNPGTVASTPSGEVIFYDMSGREVGASAFNAEQAAVAASESVTYTVPLPVELPMGRYKAFLAAEYGDALKANMHDTSFFYRVSMLQLLGIFSGLLFVVLLLLYVVYRKTHHIDHDEVPLYVQDGHSPGQDHDLDLKQNHD